MARSWWAEISVNSYSDMNYLLIFAKEAILLIVRDLGLFFFLIFHLVSYLLLLPESHTAHTGRILTTISPTFLMGSTRKRRPSEINFWVHCLTMKEE